MKTFITFVILFWVLATSNTHGKPTVGFKQSGTASYYADRFHGRKTASGERYNHHAMTAAHRYLPLGTRLLVTRKDTNQSIVVRVNDRGPYAGARVLDLSGGAAKKLNMQKVGLAKVDIKVLSLPSRK